jgi:hypothetical protein
MQSTRINLRTKTAVEEADEESLVPRKTRYLINVPVVFHWSCEGQVNGGTGFTRDISAGGVYVFSSTVPPVGSPVAMEVRLPPLAASGPGLRLQAEGHVVRVEGTQGQEGFAVAAHFELGDRLNTAYQ